MKTTVFLSFVVLMGSIANASTMQRTVTRAVSSKVLNVSHCKTESVAMGVAYVRLMAQVETVNRSMTVEGQCDDVIFAYKRGRCRNWKEVLSTRKEAKSTEWKPVFFARLKSTAQAQMNQCEAKRQAIAADIPK